MRKRLFESIFTSVGTEISKHIPYWEMNIHEITRYTIIMSIVQTEHLVQSVQSTGLDAPEA